MYAITLAIEAKPGRPRSVCQAGVDRLVDMAHQLATMSHSFGYYYTLGPGHVIAAIYCLWPRLSKAADVLQARDESAAAQMVIPSKILGSRPRKPTAASIVKHQDVLKQYLSFLQCFWRG